MASKLGPSSKIIIVGSGVFGLSTALWLARSGYQDVTVFDMQDTATEGYNPNSIDSASADINKIIRFSYGTEIDYQRLATEAAEMWEEWNRQLASTPESELPPGLRDWSGEKKLWWNSGMLRMSATSEFGEFERRTLENMGKEGIRHKQFRTDDEADLQRAKERGWAHKLDPCHRQDRFNVHKGVLDSTAGFVVAYKSCAWAKHLAEKAGVKFVLDAARGKVVDIHNEDSGTPTLQTADGTTHAGDLVIVAGGGWTPSLVPEVSSLLETTAGSIATIQIPKERTDLLERFSPENFPVITWGMREGMGIYSFPHTDGVIKIGYRGTKYTNFEDVDGQRMSVPKTAHVTEKKETNIPMKSLDSIKEYISTNLPELKEFGLSSTKLCWYTDSIDNSFVVDYVPGRQGVAICSGGSGHGFKFLPILGREVVKILEQREEKTVYRDLWKWRDGGSSKSRNGLEDGETGPRVLAKQKMASQSDWKFS